MGLLCLLAVVLYVDRICISVALPRIQDDLGIAPEHLGWVSVVFSVAYAVFEIPSGHMGDRTGARRVLMRIVVWWSAFTALTGAATGLTSLLVTRFLFGAGEAGAFPNAATAVSRWFPVRGRAAAMGMFGAASQVGGALSPLLVVPIQARFGWRASFFVFAVCGIVWAVAWYAWFRDSPAEKVGVHPSELEETAGSPPPAAHGLAWSVALRSWSLRGLMLTWFAHVYGAFFSVFWLPTYLVKSRGFSEGDLRLIAIAWVGGMLGNAGGGLLSDALVARFGVGRGRRTAALFCMTTMALGYLTVAFTTDKAALLTVMTITFATAGFSQANAFAVCIDIGRSHAGTVSAAMNTAGQIGGGVSAVAFGYLVKATGSYDAPVLVMAAVVALGALPWMFIDASREVAPSLTRSSDA